MDTSVLIDIGMAALAVLLIVVVVKILAAPIKGILKFLLHAGLGLLILFGVNLVGGFFNFYIPFSWLSVVIAGLGGIPGVILIVLYHLLF
ncbi:MAG: pro-sigmaK processing inhibitor BofA family protein [Oscillospiraceae bacterium]|nr:pro-sigmaK processing inhibitor BofA family protein [Oscillospiraceae bacterium]